MSRSSQTPSAAHVPVTAPTASPTREAQGETRYQTGKGCLTLLVLLLISVAMMVVLIMLFGNREP